MSRCEEQSDSTTVTTFDSVQVTWTQDALDYLNQFPEGHIRRRAHARIEKNARVQKVSTISVAFAKDLLNDAGQVLVGGGAELTPKLCESLKKRGVEEVCVRSVTPALSLEEVRQRLDKQFRHTEPTETMASLKALLVRFHSGGDADG